MNPLIGVLVLVLLGLLGARLSFTTGRGVLGPRLLITTGTHFLFLGFLLGSHVLALLTRSLIDQLYPFLALGLGWIGLLFGLQLDRRQLRQFPTGFLVLAVCQGLATFLLFWGVGELVLAATPLDPDDARLGLLTAAATACVSTPVAIALLSDAYGVRGRLTQLLFFIASLDALVGILALQLTYALHHPGALRSAVIALGPGQWLLLSVVLGSAFGLLFLWLTRPQPEREELVLFLVGLVIFSAGAALYLGLAPLFVTALAGAVVANLSPIRQEVYLLLQAWEKPIYVILLILAGALLSFPSWIVLPLGAAYLLVRGLAKLTAGWIGSALVRLRFSPPRELGLALLPQGGISLAMAISATLTYPTLGVQEGGFGDFVFATVVLGVVLSELVGPFVTRDVLRRAGELTPRTEAAVQEGRENGVDRGFPAAARRRPAGADE